MIKQLQTALLITIFSFTTFIGFAQRDLIITQSGEEIRCKILDETPTRFVYAYLGSKNKVLRNEIFKNLVGSFKYNHFESDVLKSEKMAPKSNNATSPRVDTRKTEISEANKENKAITAEPKKEIVVAKDSNKRKGLFKKEPKKPLEKPKTITPEKIKPKEIKKDSIGINEKAENLPKDLKEQKTELAKEKKSDPSKVTEVITSKSMEVEPKIGSKSMEVEPKTASKTMEVETSKQETSPFASSSSRSEFKDFMKFRVGVKGGLGNLISKNDETTPIGLYKEKLNRGWLFGADAAYFFKDNLGAGLLYNSFQSNNKSDKFDFPDLFTGEPVKAGSLSTRVSHKFIGPTFIYRKSIDFKTFAVVSLSPGMHLYTEKGLFNASNYKFKGNSYGAVANLGLDFLIGNDIFGRDIILSLEGGYSYGKISSLNYGGDVGSKSLANPIDLSRLDISVGLRFTRFPMYLR